MRLCLPRRSCGMVTPYNKQTVAAVCHWPSYMRPRRSFFWKTSRRRQTVERRSGMVAPYHHTIWYHSSAPNKKYLPSNPHTALATCPALLYENSWRISHRRTGACPSQQTCWQTPTTSSRNDRLMDRLRTRSLPHVRLPQPKKKLSKTKRMICTRNGLCQAYR